MGMIDRQAVAHDIGHSFRIGGVPCSPSYTTLDASGNNSLALRTLFSQEMIKNGVLMPWIALAFRHGDDELNFTEHAIDRSFAIYRKALDYGVDKFLEGPSIKPVFRKFN